MSGVAQSTAAPPHPISSEERPRLWASRGIVETDQRGSRLRATTERWREAEGRKVAGLTFVAGVPELGSSGCGVVVPQSNVTLVNIGQEMHKKGQCPSRMVIVDLVAAAVLYDARDDLSALSNATKGAGCMANCPLRQHVFCTYRTPHHSHPHKDRRSSKLLYADRCKHSHDMAIAFFRYCSTPYRVSHVNANQVRRTALRVGLEPHVHANA